MAPSGRPSAADGWLSLNCREGFGFSRTNPLETTASKLSTTKRTACKRESMPVLEKHADAIRHKLLHFM